MRRRVHVDATRDRWARIRARTPVMRMADGRIEYRTNVQTELKRLMHWWRGLV